MSIDPIMSGPNMPPAGGSPRQREDGLLAAAKKLEATFLAEMLKIAGFGKSSESFGGGAGEDQFASFLVQAQAERLVERGGIGLAETFFEALKKEARDG